MKLIAILILSGCGISVKVVDLQWATTGYAQEMNKRTMNVQSGNQSALVEADSNVIYESQKYKQLKNKPLLPNE
jgi:hypothetical protein